MGPECTAESADKAETGGNLKVRAGKTAGNETYSESALSTRKLLHLAMCPAEKLLHQHLPVHPAKSADISKPTAE